MTKWTLISRKPQRPEEAGLVIFDLTFEGKSPLALRFSEVERIQVLLSNAISGFNDEISDRFDCVPVSEHLVLKVDGIAWIALTRSESEALREDLNRAVNPAA
jgi:hypothetical protein